MDYETAGGGDQFLCHKREMYESFYSKPGRNYKATYAVDGLTIPNELLPPDVIILNYDDADSGSSRHLRVERLNCRIKQNTVEHKTFHYEQTTDAADDSRQLVLRRGQRFSFAIAFNRPYNPDIDDVVFNFQFGDEVAGVSNGSRISIRLSNGIKPNNWSAGIVQSEDRCTVVEFLSPPNGIIGKATLTIDTEVTGGECSPQHGSSKSLEGSVAVNGSGEGEEEGGEEEGEEEDDEEEQTEDDGSVRVQKRRILRYVNSQPIYFLFNPWLKDDQVYLGDEELCQQYVLKDFGKIYYGNQHQISSRPWNYGQFESGILDKCVYLLDMARLRPTSRGSAVSVVHTIAKLVNAADDKGLMIGNWSGNYSDGTPPTQWTGSVPILNEFWESKEPVKYGQCWVFAAIATTICRALGLPARCITNFASAHDCDGEHTINIHWNTSGEPVDDWNTDTIWSFHVWNEVYSSRPDLESGSPGGWQVFNVTPQIASDGVYCAGPCAVKSVKRGDIFQRYDCSLVFFDIYTDIIHWTLEDTGNWRTTIEKNRTGRLLLTDGPNAAISVPSMTSSASGEEEEDTAKFPVVDVSAECQDVSRLYKHPQGSEEERASLQRANTCFHHIGVYDKGDGDVKYEVEQHEPVPVGTEFSIIVRAQNTCRFERTVAMTLTLVAIHYTGLTRTRLRSETFNFNLCSLRHRQIVMRVSVEDYSYLLSEFAMFRVYMHAVVDETDQLTASFSDFRLILPQLDIEAPSKACVGQPVECTVRLLSPMLISLQKCQWMVEALGMLPAVKLPQSELEPYEKAQVKVTLNPTRAGKAVVVASFHSKELTGLTGAVEIEVSEPKEQTMGAAVELF